MIKDKTPEAVSGVDRYIENRRRIKEAVEKCCDCGREIQFGSLAIEAELNTRAFLCPLCCLKWRDLPTTRVRSN